MKDAASVEPMAFDQDPRISELFERERTRLGRFIRGRVGDPGDAEDLLQDVFAELVEANRLLMPIEHITGWLFRVARNRIVDRFRRKRSEPLGAEGDAQDLAERLPSPDAGPEALYLRGVLLDELEDAIAELPAEQRAAFVAHELECRTFKQLAEETGVGVSTLLSRKRYAVLRLRDRLRSVWDELRGA